jgi:hypothetical protein
MRTGNVSRAVGSTCFDYILFLVIIAVMPITQMPVGRMLKLKNDVFAVILYDPL